MENDTASQLLEALPLGAVDAARLVLETTEMLSTRTAGIDRLDMLQLMRRVIRLGVNALNERENTKTFAEAGWASIEARAGRRPTTRRDLRYYMRKFLRAEGIAGRPLRAITTKECAAVLRETCGSCPSTFKKGRMVLHSVFEFGIQQEWCDTNPVARIKVPTVEEKTIMPLTLEEVNRLEQTAMKPKHRDMRLSLNLMLYCGVRPTEVSRVKPEQDIDWHKKEVLIRPQTSKTGGGRVIPMRKAAHIPVQDRVIPTNWNNRWHKLRKDAGFNQWQADACRHTFASYHAMHFHNLPMLQQEMGHRNQNLLHTRYVTAFLDHNAAGFWR